MYEECYADEAAYLADVSALADECVARGVAHLDDTGPKNWRELINLDTVALWDPQSCIAGQVFKGFARTPEHAYRGRDGDDYHYDSGYDYWEHNYRVEAPSGWYGFNTYEDDDLFVSDIAMMAAWERALSA